MNELYALLTNALPAVRSTEATGPRWTVKSDRVGLAIAADWLDESDLPYAGLLATVLRSRGPAIGTSPGDTFSFLTLWFPLDLEESASVQTDSKGVLLAPCVRLLFACLPGNRRKHLLIRLNMSVAMDLIEPAA